MRVLLLSADKYSVTNETTGELLEGTTLYYLNNYRDDSNSSLGFKPTKMSASLSVFESIKKSGFDLPAFCDLEISTRPGAMNKAALVAVSCIPSDSVTLF